MCPVTAKPGGEGLRGVVGGDEWSDQVQDEERRSRGRRLTEVAAAVGPAHVQREDVGGRHLQLLVHLHSDITSEAFKVKASRPIKCY